jgi:outer membrane protein TolC
LNRGRLFVSFALAAGLFAGCASYRPEPLAAAPGMARDVARIEVDASRMPLPRLRSHRFDPSDGLDIDEVAMLAVANNPQLKVARDRLGVVRAQAFAAGLLPDPQLALASDHPTSGAGATNAFSLGLSEDVRALLTHPVARRAAQAHTREVNLDLLWQEWQVVSRARLLFVRNLEQRRLLGVLRQNKALFEERAQRARAALAEGNVTLEAVSADLVALQEAGRQIDELERRLERNRLSLDLLLGLEPGTRLDLVGGATLPPLDEAGIRARLKDLARRRPDLLALRAGYQSQELRTREAVLAQFPALDVGLNRARDTSDVYTLGIGVTLSLPIFDGNRGNIAIQRATRRSLRDRYAQRVAAAQAEVHGILESQRLLERQLQGVRSSLAELGRATASADEAYRAGNLSELAYAGLRAGLLAKRVEDITLRQRILEQRVALATLVGGDLPIDATKGTQG